MITRQEELEAELHEERTKNRPLEDEKARYPAFLLYLSSFSLFILFSSSFSSLCSSLMQNIYQDMYAQEREEREAHKVEISRLERELQFKNALSGYVLHTCLYIYIYIYICILFILYCFIIYIFYDCNMIL